MEQPLRQQSNEENNEQDGYQAVFDDSLNAVGIHAQMLRPFHF
jgi:hypothetical protein